MKKGNSNLVFLVAVLVVAVLVVVLVVVVLVQTNPKFLVLMAISSLFFRMALLE